MAPGPFLFLAVSILVLSVSSHQGHVFYPEALSFGDQKDNTKLYAPPPSKNACKLPAPAAGYLSEGFVPKGSYNSPSAPSTGIIKTKLFFVDFPDAPANDSTKWLYDALVPGSQAWFRTSSYDRLRLEVDADMSQFYRMPQASSKYTFNRRGAKQEMYIKDALSVANQDFKTKQYDVLYIMPTRAAAEITFSPTKIGPTRFNGSVIPNVVTYGQDLHLKYGFKILNHETGHTIGLPDLYPADNTKLPRGEWAGGFDIMGLINGTHPDFFAWHKWKLGWLDDEQINCISVSGTSKHTIAPVEIPGGVKAAVIKLSATTALAVEVRSQLAVQNPNCPVGLVAYVINTLATNSRNAPITVLHGHPSSAGCEPDRGGKLTTAAVDFAKGDKVFNSAEYGLRITIDGVKDGKYDISLQWSGATGASSTVPKAPGGQSGLPRGQAEDDGDEDEDE
jgi:M6 family metalloprotease-like protein